MGTNHPQDNWQRAAPSATASVSAYATAYFVALPAQYRGRSMIANGKLLLKTHNQTSDKKMKVWVPLQPSTSAAALATAVDAALAVQGSDWGEYSAT
jgi:hypothetical protein